MQNTKRSAKKGGDKSAPLPKGKASAKTKGGSILFPDSFDPIAIELKRAREAAGLTHSDLHKQTKISRAVLLGYERGRTKPGARELRLLCQALRVSPSRLLFGTDEMFKPSPGFRTLMTLRRSPGLMMMSMLAFMPMVAAVLDDEQISSLISLVGSLVEARDRETYIQMCTFVEVFMEQVGTGSPQEIEVMQQRNKDPKYQQWLGEEVQRRIAAALNNK